MKEGREREEGKEGGRVEGGWKSYDREGNRNLRGRKVDSLAYFFLLLNVRI